jgi:PAS domain S-box-containing protein
MMHGAAGTTGRGAYRKFEKRIGVLTLALVPIFLAALAAWLGSEYQRLSVGETETRRTLERQLLLSELFSTVKDAETGQRGFVLTGDESFLAPYRAARSTVRAQIVALRSAGASGAQGQRLDRMERLIDEKFAEMERVIVVRRMQGLAAAARIVAEGRGQRLMDDVRSEAAITRAAETKTLEHMLAEQDERTRQSERIIWLVVAVVGLTFVGSGVLFWRGENQRGAWMEEAEEAGARRRAIFDSTLDAIILINPSGSIETMNRAAMQLFGYSSDQLIRRDISLIVDLAPGDGPFLQRIGLGPDGLAEPFRHPLSARRADGTRIPVEAALGVMPLPDGIHIVAALRDVSEREKAERIKDQFLSTVSHELRTPLTSIVGSLGLLRGGASGELSASAQRLLVIAENNANRLIRLVNDLLDIEKFEAGEMAFDFQAIDLRESAARALEAIRGMAQAQQVELALERDPEPVMVRGDAERLIQVFTNLLANAVRFTPAGKKVTLVVRRRASHAEASIVDEGPGIDDELRGRLFTRFAQSMQAPGQTRGTGLGLAISREIMRAHGGGIWYDPAPRGGSVFSFNLPLWNLVTAQPESGEAPRVLICAGDEQARSIAAALKNRAIRADVAGDPAAMSDALAARRYIAILIDWHWLAEDVRLFQRIRHDPVSAGLPVIVVEAAELEAGRFASLDVVDWIPRPLDATRLNDAVASALDRAAASMPLILHVEDDMDTLELTAAALEGRARMAQATDVASARAFMAENRPDIVIIDLALPDGSGEDLLADLSGDLSIPVIVYSAQERNGAFAREVSAVLTKSKRSLSSLVETINDILDRQK